MGEDVQLALAALRQEIAELRSDLRARDERLVAKDAQIAALMEVIARLTKVPVAPVQLALPVGQSVQQVYEAFAAAHANAHSWPVMRNRLKAFVKEFGPLPAMGLTPAMWKAHRVRRKVAEPVSRTRGEKYSPLTINFELGWAKKMLNWASDPEQNLIPSNPIGRVKAEQVDAARDTWLTMVEVRKLLEHWRDNRVMRLWLLIAVSTGLRISEVLRIRRDRIRPSVAPNGQPIGIIELSKRENKTRRTYYAAIPPTTMNEIESQPADISQLLFPSPYRPGRAYGARHISRLFRQGCEATGIDYRAADGDGHVRAHDVRHSAATLASQEGATLPQVQRMLNHTTPTHTVRYLHFDEADAVTFAMLMEGGLDLKPRRDPQKATAALTSLGKFSSGI
jgi:integrase/recombinase XerD